MADREAGEPQLPRQGKGEAQHGLSIAFPPLRRPDAVADMAAVAPQPVGIERMTEIEAPKRAPL